MVSFMKSFLSFLAAFGSLVGCAFDLGFEPTRLYKFSAWLKYNVDNNVSQEELEIQLFTSYENLCSYFDEFTYPYGVLEQRDKAENDILKHMDFERSNLLGYMKEEGTGSIIHAVSVEENNIAIYSYVAELGTDDMAYKWLIFEVDKKYALSDFIIETKDMTETQADYLRDSFAEEYWF